MGALAEAFEKADASAVPDATVKPLSKVFDDIKVEPVKKASTEPARSTGVIESIGAGAGEATGRGVLALQQIVGKLTSWGADAINSQAGRDAGAWLERDAVSGARTLEAQNARYAAGSPKANLAGEITGLVLNPVNKLIPMGAAPSTLVGAAAKGAAQGAALNAATTPVTDQSKDFLTEKARQAMIGTIGGAAGGSLAYGIGMAMRNGIERLIAGGNRLIAGDATKAAEALTTKTMADVGLNPAAVKVDRPELFNYLTQKAKDAISTGKPVDPAEFARLMQAQTLPVPVPMLKGQLSRDPMQFAMEQNLRGMTGVGEPITQLLTAQNRALVENLNAMGAKEGKDLMSAGTQVISAMNKADKSARQGVTEVYNAFKAATGREIDVPLKGLAQDYAKILSDFGDAIPSAVRGKFDALGLLSGKQTKVFSIEDAESLIKVLNQHYDPVRRAEATAIDSLRRSVQKAIVEGSGESAIGTQAAGLAQAARAAAKQRFDLIDSTPGLDAAIKGVQPDKFIEKFILGGNVAEVKNVMSVLSKSDPEAAKALQGAVMNHIKESTLNRHTDANGVFSADQLKRFVMDQHMSARLEQVLGPEKLGQLRQLYNVAENAIYAPVASAVNRSNTTSAAANIVKSEIQGGSWNTLLDVLKRAVPVVSTPASEAQKAVQANRSSALVDSAINPSLSQSVSTRLSDILGEQLSKGMRPDVATSRATAAAAAEETRRQNRK